MPTYARLASDYLAAALPLGLHVRRCEEPRTPSPLLGDDGVTLYDGVRLPDPVPGDPPYIWSLHSLLSRPRTRPGRESLPRSSGTSAFLRIRGQDRRVLRAACVSAKGRQHPKQGEKNMPRPISCRDAAAPPLALRPRVCCQARNVIVATADRWMNPL